MHVCVDCLNLIDKGRSIPLWEVPSLGGAVVILNCVTVETQAVHRQVSMRALTYVCTVGGCDVTRAGNSFLDFFTTTWYNLESEAEIDLSLPCSFWPGYLTAATDLKAPLFVVVMWAGQGELRSGRFWTWVSSPQSIRHFYLVRNRTD